MYAMALSAGPSIRHSVAPAASDCIRDLTEMEVDAVAGRGCGVDAAVGALVGFQIGGVAGALIGAAIAGGFCVAGNAV